MQGSNQSFYFPPPSKNKENEPSTTPHTFIANEPFVAPQRSQQPFTPQTVPPSASVDSPQWQPRGEVPSSGFIQDPNLYNFPNQEYIASTSAGWENTTYSPGSAQPLPSSLLQQPQVFGATFARLGVQYGSQLLQAGGVGKQEVQEVARWLRLVKYYFMVDNRYVLRKLGILLFPWMNKSWLRKKNTDAYETANKSSLEEYLPACEDINAPELYIPSMALVTYILLGSLVRGTRGEFTPEIMGTIASSSLAAVVLEVLLVKLGLFLVGSKQGAWLDLVSYSGYKFVGLVFVTIIGLLFNLFISQTAGRVCSSVAIIYFASVMGLFLMRTYRRVLHTPDSTIHTKASLSASKLDSRKNYFLLGVALIQFLFFWLLKTKM
eukprot:jgi/Galph1/5161/GphlegSOOS_G3817.1